MRAASKTAASGRGRTKQMPATIPAEQAIAAQSTRMAGGLEQECTGSRRSSRRRACGFPAAFIGVTYRA